MRCCLGHHKTMRREDGQTVWVPTGQGMARQAFPMHASVRVYAYFSALEHNQPHNHAAHHTFLQPKLEPCCVHCMLFTTRHPTQPHLPHQSPAVCCGCPGQGPEGQQVAKIRVAKSVGCVDRRPGQRDGGVVCRYETQQTAGVEAKRYLRGVVGVCRARRLGWKCDWPVTLPWRAVT